MVDGDAIQGLVDFGECLVVKTETEKEAAMGGYNYNCDYTSAGVVDRCWLDEEEEMGRSHPSYRTIKMLG